MDNYDDMSTVDLRRLVRERGLANGGAVASARKDDLIALLKDGTPLASQSLPIGFFRSMILAAAAAGAAHEMTGCMGYPCALPDKVADQYEVRGGVSSMTRARARPALVRAADDGPVRPKREQETMSTPYTVKTMMEQLGTGLNGALAYVGAHRLCHAHPVDCRDRECRPSHDSMVNANGTVKAEVALWFRVNTRRDVRICVAYETDDTYTVYLWRANGPAKRLETGKMGEVLEESHDVYCDMLAEVVERFYDEYIRQYQAGAILI